MKILRLPIEIDLSASGLEAAAEVMTNAGEPGPILNLIVSPDDLVEARRLLVHLQEHGTSEHLRLLALYGRVEANYAWIDAASGRWMVIGKDHILYTPGAGS